MNTDLYDFLRSGSTRLTDSAKKPPTPTSAPSVHHLNLNLNLFAFWFVI
jgi:hypothetical protein